MAQEALGRLVDISIGAAPVDLAAAAVTGARVSLTDAGGVTIVVAKGAGTAATDPTFTLQEHDAGTGGTSQNLAVIDHYFLKQEATLDGDETWTRVEQTAAATVTGNGTSAEEQALYVFEVAGTSLSDGFTHVSLNVADVGTGAQLGCVLYLLRDLNAQRAPELLSAPQ